MSGYAGIIMAVVETAASLASGAAKAVPYREEAKLAEYDARNMELQGKQMSAARRQQLNQTLSAIDVIRSGRNLGYRSQGDLILKDAVRDNLHQVETAEQLALGVQIAKRRLQGKQAKSRATWVMVEEFANAAPSMGSFGSFGMGGGSGGGGSSGGSGASGASSGASSAGAAAGG